MADQLNAPARPILSLQKLVLFRRRCSRNLHFDLYSAVQNSVLRFVTSKSLVAHTRAK